MMKELQNILIETQSVAIDKFVERWSQSYNNSQEDMYTNHIQSALSSKESFITLFKWKNGTGNQLAVKKEELVKNLWSQREVLNSLDNLDAFERIYKPTTSATIWKIFLLHIARPDKYPIFDQHVFRFHNFQMTGQIEEPPSSRRKLYDYYCQNYMPWFNEAHKESNNKLARKKMDEAFFAFGKALKSVKYLVIQE